MRTSEVDIRHELLILLGEWALPIKHLMFGVIIRQKAICLILTIGFVVGRRVAPHVYVPTFVISPHAAEQLGTVLVSGGFSTQRSRIDNHKRKCRVEMANEPAINKLGWAIIITVLAILGFAWQWLTSDSATSTPNLYDLTRQTAGNTRHISWLILVGFVGIVLTLRKG